MASKQHSYRLERLFSKRKGFGVTAAEAEPTGQEQVQPLFPQPSFIRPTSSRMMARDEVAVRLSPGRRAQSLPDQHAPTRMSFAHSQKPSTASTSNASTSNLQCSPVRSTPLLKRRAVDVPELQEFQFPNHSQQSGETSPTSLASSSVSPTEVLLPKGRIESIDECAVFVPPRVDTPPASDPEDTFSANDRFHKKLPALPFNDMPTPGPSPEMAPIPDSRLSDPKVGEMLNSTLYSDIQRRLDNAMPGYSLRKSLSFSDLAPSSSSIYSVLDTILREPTFNDFLDLSDDDIAEVQPEPQTETPQAELPPTPPSTASTGSTMSVSRPPGPSLLTLTPPFASRPATAAAFEAARIAARYSFDLVYVVNLWPDKTSDPMSTPTRSEAKSGMTGRLLAAYGLSTVKSPFRISAAVHSKILQGDGWIEYRNQEAQTDEFARGYACAFYTGQYGRRSSADSAASSPNTKPQKHAIDRGIVFAAYRKPREDGTVAAVSCTKAELATIHRDAEALVEMLIDIHAANRLREPPSSYSLHSDDTGPMPGQRSGMA